jgi:hypothetical protein
MCEEECALMQREGLNEAQIAFRREMQANFGKSARQEFAEDPETCFQASGECVFELEILEKRLAATSGPCEVHEDGRFFVWWPPVRGRRYVIGVDPAGGGPDGDAACAQVIDRETGMQCAELLGHLRPEELEKQVAKLGQRYSGSLVAVERNNHGHAVLACLRMSERYEAIYRGGNEAGWLTTAASRPAMVENLVELVRTRPELIHSRRLLAECRTFVRGEHGRPEAARGAHDDAVMAMAIAQAVRSGLR